MAERWVRGTQISERRRCNVQVSSLFSRYLFLNIFPFALNVYPCSSLHFSNSLGLFFSCSNADATASAPGMSGSAATEKHVDSLRREIRRTNLESTRKCLRPALSGPLVKQRWIVRELQQRRSNMLGFRHFFVR